MRALIQFAERREAQAFKTALLCFLGMPVHRCMYTSAFSGSDAPGARLPSGMGHIYFSGLGLWKSSVVVCWESLFNKWEGLRTQLQDLTMCAFKHRSLLMCLSLVAWARLRGWGEAVFPGEQSVGRNKYRVMQILSNASLNKQWDIVSLILFVEMEDGYCWGCLFNSQKRLLWASFLAPLLMLLGGF